MKGTRINNEWEQGLETKEELGLDVELELMMNLGPGIGKM